MSKRTPEPDGAIRSEVFAGEYTRVVTTFGARKLGACKVSFGDAALQSPIADGCRKPRNSGAARASTAPSQTRSSLVSTHKNGPLPPMRRRRQSAPYPSAKNILGPIQRIFIGFERTCGKLPNRAPLLTHPPIRKLTLETFHNSVSHHGIPLVGQADER